MNMQKLPRYSYSLYLTRVQEKLVKDWVNYKELVDGHKYKSDHVFATLFDVMKNNVEFNEYISKRDSNN